MNKFQIGDKIRYYITDDYYRDTVYEVRGFVDGFVVARYQRWTRNINDYIGSSKLEWFYVVIEDTSNYRKEGEISESGKS